MRDELKVKYNSGNYICVSTWKNNTNWGINKQPSFNDFEVADYKLIHKKHEDVLNAYLEDDSVEIWQTWEGAECKGEVKERFIDNYDETSIYEVAKKGKQEPQLNNFQDYGFEADFEGEILKEINGKLLGYVIDSEAIAFWWDSKTGKINENYSNAYDLKPIKKKWYEDESNFPCVIFNSVCFHIALKYTEGNILYSHYGWDKANGVRLATKEEIDSLYYEDKTC